MIELILALTMSPAIQNVITAGVEPKTEPDIAVLTAKVKPCIWPNPCGSGFSA